MTRHTRPSQPRPWSGLAVALALLLLAPVHGRPDDASDVALEAVRRLKGTDLSANPALRAAVENVADRLRGQPASVEVIRDFDLRSRAGHLVEFLAAHPEDAAAPDALRYLARIDPALPGKLLASQAVPPALLKAIGRSGQPEWNDRLASLLSSPAAPAGVREAAMDALIQNEPGARAVAEVARKGGLPAPLLDRAAEGLRNARWPAVRELAVGLGRGPAAQPSTPGAPPRERVLKAHGDVARGAQLLRRDSVGCLACHKVRAEGADFGPALTEIGSKLGKDALYDAIVEPSAGIGFGYEGWLVVTRDGDEHVGMVASETDSELVLKQAGGNSVRIRKADVARKDKQAQSLMPAGLADNLGVQGLADVLAYLATLRAPAPSP